MNVPDFKSNDVYAFSVFNEDGLLICEGFMNEKAWSKTIENNCIWEYIADNSRVIEKELSGYELVMEKTGVVDNKIVISVIPDSVCECKPVDFNMVIANLEKLIGERFKDMPENSYTTHLFSKGEDKILKKLGEEVIEVILAKSSRSETVYEIADVIYHMMVYLVYKGIPFNDILSELDKRMNK